MKEKMLAEALKTRSMRPVGKVILVYMMVGLMLALLMPEAPDADVPHYIISHSLWLRELLPAIGSLARISNAPTVALCFFVVMWGLFPLLVLAIFMKLPKPIEDRPSVLVRAALVAFAASSLVFICFALYGKSHDVGITHSRGAYAMQVMMGTRVGLAVIGSAIIAFAAAGYACAVRFMFRLFGR